MSAKWEIIEQKALENNQLRREDLLAVLDSSDNEILDIVEAARKVREKYFGKKIKLQYLVNIKSGLCSEDCTYCSQSKVSDAPIQKYPLLSTDEIKKMARQGLDAGATKICLVASGEEPSLKEINSLAESIGELKNDFPQIELCASLGLLNERAAEDLGKSGLETYNHNINTSESFYKEICTTHSYSDRIDTIERARLSGLHICSGVLVGMGESAQDIVDMALTLREKNVDYIPVNFLVPVDQTPLAGFLELTPFHSLRILALMRFANPTKEIRIAGGREFHLRTFQPLGLMIANSIFIGDYLTTRGQTPAMDLAMIRDLGYQIEGRPENFIDEFLKTHPEVKNDIGQILVNK